MANENLLSPQEVLLLENLMYLSGNGKDSPLRSVTGYEGKSVRDLINAIDVGKLENSQEYTGFTTGSEWKDIINAVKSNDTLMNMEIAAVHTDHAEGGGGGVSAVFTNSDTGEAVVAFQGTASYEWKDDFIGGGPTNASDGVSTPQQENALEWYQSAYEDLGLDGYTVTVTGHSKGGNKAKYIAVLDESVDRCISFDGQGFSDEFMEKYETQISERQNVIENHNVNYDYVNLLLNDIGSKTYYKGNNYGDGGILEAHCPNTFFGRDKDGNLTMNVSEDGQASEMAELDKFLNSYLRSLSPEDKAEALELIGGLVEGGFNGADMDTLISTLLNSGNDQIAAYLLAYLIEYEQATPGFMESIQSILEEFGLGDFNKILEIVDEVLEWKYFDQIAELLGKGGKWLGDKLPDWALEWLSDLIYDKFGIRLSKDEVRKLFGIVALVSGNIGNITIKKDSGKDKTVASKSDFSGGDARFTVNPQELLQAVNQLAKNTVQLTQMIDELHSVEGQLGLYGIAFRPVLRRIEVRMEKEAKAAEKMASVLEQAGEKYQSTERSIVNY